MPEDRIIPVKYEGKTIGQVWVAPHVTKTRPDESISTGELSDIIRGIAEDDPASVVLLAEREPGLALLAKGYDIPIDDYVSQDTLAQAVGQSGALTFKELQSINRPLSKRVRYFVSQNPEWDEGLFPDDPHSPTERKIIEGIRIGLKRADINHMSELEGQYGALARAIKDYGWENGLFPRDNKAH
ncbi:hypothetical protein GOV09_02910 [Candidatus Woesearchaeota archaeon]|nr:hypothetical protein [Candidatus Woesearchaeota archaeon]